MSLEEYKNNKAKVGELQNRNREIANLLVGAEVKVILTPKLLSSLDWKCNAWGISAKFPKGIVSKLRKIFEEMELWDLRIPYIVPGLPYSFIVLDNEIFSDWDDKIATKALKDVHDVLGVDISAAIQDRKKELKHAKAFIKSEQKRIKMAEAEIAELES